FCCQWHIPQAHYLESWGDVRAYNGLVSVIQPLIAPLYRGRSTHELIAALAGVSPASTYEIVRDYWRERSGGEDFEAAWRSWLERGFIPDTELPPQRVSVQGNID